ncbi:hypothetical protein [Bacillus kwashiorkori]|uniref:hypothetical protein n=1 Tax=Bacillus kwashiorkori TaxID=1522318 RepID=UPI000783BF2F|nr:hypothetical protein [Bacillus kwashiorkori]
MLSTKYRDFFVVLAIIITTFFLFFAIFAGSLFTLGKIFPNDIKVESFKGLSVYTLLLFLFFALIYVLEIIWNVVVRLLNFTEEANLIVQIIILVLLFLMYLNLIDGVSSGITITTLGKLIYCFILTFIGCVMAFFQWKYKFLDD